MSTSLDASTVTPGSTAPDVSRTTPVMDDWACAICGANMSPSPSSIRNAFRRMSPPLTGRINEPPTTLQTARLTRFKALCQILDKFQGGLLIRSQPGRVNRSDFSRLALDFGHLPGHNHICC